MAATVRKNFAISDGLHLSCIEWAAEKADCRPVIMLHGLADHGLVWQGLATALGSGYRCIAPDLRGHGESSKPPETEYDARSLAEDLEALAAHLSLHEVDVVAHSWAAKVALVWARQQPGRIRRLVLVDPFFVNRFARWWRLTFPILYRVLPFLKVMGPFESYEAAEAIARELKQYEGWSELQAQTFQAGMEQKPDGRWGSKFSVAARNGVFLDTLGTAGLTETLPVPTCLILPVAGLNKQTWQLKPYRQYLSALTERQVPGNHWPHLTAPEACGQAVAEFLSAPE